MFLFTVSSVLRKSAKTVKVKMSVFLVSWVVVRRSFLWRFSGIEEGLEGIILHV